MGGYSLALVLAALVATVATLLVMLLILNLSSRERYLEHEIPTCFGVHDPRFERTIGCLLGPALLEGNRVETFVNGAEYFPRMLDDIRRAERSIVLETFIYWSGEIGHQFTEALIERADAGVRVYLLVDWLGSWKMDRRLLDRIRASKVLLERYRPPNWHNILTLNNRTHRKLLVVDGRVGWTGGAGLADAWAGNAQDTNHWRDTQFRAEGPVVAQMQTAFLDNWMQTHAEVLLGDAFFPELESRGTQKAQNFMSGPGEGSESARLMILISIACAQKTVKLAHGYFVPDQLSVKTLVAAARRGVRIQIIVQGPTDAPHTRRAGRARWGPLLEAGIEIYEYQPAMFHCKTLIVDDLWASVGSANFDNRSFRLNDEANLNVLDADFAREQAAIFEKDRLASKCITLADYHARARWDKSVDTFWSLFRNQM